MTRVTILGLAATMVAGSAMAADAASINGTLTSTGSDDFFIADFDGYVAESISAPANWGAGVENTSVRNLLFTYGGATIISP